MNGIDPLGGRGAPAVKIDPGLLKQTGSVLVQGS
jgi:hypothetical protein